MHRPSGLKFTIVSLTTLVTLLAPCAVLAYGFAAHMSHYNRILETYPAGDESYGDLLRAHREYFLYGSCFPDVQYSARMKPVLQQMHQVVDDAQYAGFDVADGLTYELNLDIVPDYEFPLGFDTHDKRHGLEFADFMLNQAAELDPLGPDPGGPLGTDNWSRGMKLAFAAGFYAHLSEDIAAHDMYVPDRIASCEMAALALTKSADGLQIPGASETAVEIMLDHRLGLPQAQLVKEVFYDDIWVNTNQIEPPRPTVLLPGDSAPYVGPNPALKFFHECVLAWYALHPEYFQHPPVSYLGFEVICHIARMQNRFYPQAVGYGSLVDAMADWVSNHIAYHTWIDVTADLINTITFSAVTGLELNLADIAFGTAQEGVAGQVIYANEALIGLMVSDSAGAQAIFDHHTDLVNATEIADYKNGPIFMSPEYLLTPFVDHFRNVGATIFEEVGPVGNWIDNWVPWSESSMRYAIATSLNRFMPESYDVESDIMVMDCFFANDGQRLDGAIDFETISQEPSGLVATVELYNIRDVAPVAVSMIVKTAEGDVIGQTSDVMDQDPLLYNTTSRKTISVGMSVADIEPYCDYYSTQDLVIELFANGSTKPFFTTDWSDYAALPKVDPTNKPIYSLFDSVAYWPQSLRIQGGTPRPEPGWADGAISLGSYTGRPLVQCAAESGAMYTAYVSGSDITLRKVDYQFNTIWEQHQVAAGGVDDGPAVTADASGGVYVMWSTFADPDFALWISHFAADGTPIYSSRVVVQYDAYESPHGFKLVESATGSGVMCTWVVAHDDPYLPESVAAQLLDASGNRAWNSPLVVGAEAKDRRFDVHSSPTGYVVVWDRTASNGSQVVATRVWTNGTITTAWVHADSPGHDSFLIGSQSLAAGGYEVVYRDSAGSWVAGLNSSAQLSWTSIITGATTSGGAVAIRRSDGAGVFVARMGVDNGPISMYRWGAAGCLEWGPVSLSASPGNKTRVSVLPAGASSWSVLWQLGDVAFVQRVDIDGTTLWRDGGLPIAEDLMQDTAALFDLPGTAIGWTSADHIHKALHVHNPATGAAVESNCTPGNPASYIRACPAGDDGSLVITVSLTPGEVAHDIAAEDITIGVSEIAIPEAALIKMFGTGPIVATGPASAANGFATTIVISQLGGWGAGEIPVLVEGKEIGTAHIALRTADFDAGGSVNIGDLGVFSSAMSSYDERADFVPYPGPADGVVNISDISYLAEHYGHGAPSAQKSYAMLPMRADAILRLEAAPVGSGYEANGAHGVSVVADLPSDTGIVLAVIDARSDESGSYWWEDAGASLGVSSVAMADAHDPSRIIVIASGLSAGTQCLGRIAFRSDPGAPDAQIAIVEGQMLDSSGRSYQLVIDDSGRGLGRVGAETSLGDVSPNPFNPMTTISYTLAQEGRVNLKIYDMRGRQVASLVDNVESSGPHTAVWNGSDGQGRAVAAGVYFCRMETEGFTGQMKLLLVK